LTRILFKSSVIRDPRRISRNDKERILNAIEASLGVGAKGDEPLHGEFEGLFKFRVGDYRVIHVFVGQDVLVLRIRHRGKAY
jgi:mRNA-degrading endonuclease RelE of RelBE toxin-antitoxin system